MKRIRLLPVGDFDRGLAERLAAPLAREFAVAWEIAPQALDPEVAYHPERQQYHSTELLVSMQSRLDASVWRMIAVADVDLYIPILTFVFGEAQLKGPCSVVSTHRLRQEFYGLPPDQAALEQRLLKESVHELGHTLGLTHCDDHQCAMAASHAVEWIDLKTPNLCSVCRSMTASAKNLVMT